MKVRHPSRPQAGLTLIELLVAIVILSILGVMSYRAVEHAATSRDRLAADYAAWQQLARALSQVEHNLQQIAARSGAPASPAPIHMTALSDLSSQLVFERIDTNTGTRLVGFAFRNNQLELLRWPSTDRSLEPQRDVLLGGVNGMAWRFYPNGGQGWTDTLPDDAILPSGISVELDTQRYGKISRVFALR